VFSHIHVNIARYSINTSIANISISCCYTTEGSSGTSLQHIQTARNLQQTVNKVVPVHTMKAYRQSRGIAPHILNSSTRVRWVVNFMPWPLSPWNVCRYPRYRRLGWPRASLGHFGKEEDLLHLLGSEPQIIQPVALSLYWLSYPSVGSCHTHTLVPQVSHKSITIEWAIK
jgi:hypothetical protein